jgi:hypothetical protein
MSRVLAFVLAQRVLVLAMVLLLIGVGIGRPCTCRSTRFPT